MQICSECGAELYHYSQVREFCDECDREDYLRNLGGDKL